MKHNNPNHAWLTAWALFQVGSVLLAMTIVTGLLDTLPVKQAIYTGIVLVTIHCCATYALLLASNVATESPVAVVASATGGILAVAAFPAEPRLAQTLAATVFVGVVLWQALLKLTEE